LSVAASAFERAQKFAADLTKTVQGVLPESPAFRAMASQLPFVQVSVFEGDEARIAKLPLFVSGEHVGDWKLSMSVNLDSSGDYLKVMRSNFSLFADPERIPLVRYEFDDDMRTAPIAHWQFHGERGAFSYLLGCATAAGRGRPGTRGGPSASARGRP